MDDGHSTVAGHGRVEDACGAAAGGSVFLRRASDPSAIHLLLPYRTRSTLPAPGAAVDTLCGSVVVRSLAESFQTKGEPAIRWFRHLCLSDRDPDHLSLLRFDQDPRLITTL